MFGIFTSIAKSQGLFEVSIKGDWITLDPCYGNLESIYP